MMKDWTTMRKRRAAFFLLFLLALVGTLIFCRQLEEKICMDVPILSEQEQAKLGRYAEKNLSWELLHNGQLAAVDQHTDTVYISQDIRPGMKPEDLLGSLGTVSASIRLSFAPDGAFGDLATAVEAGHVFKLNAEYGSDKYTQYDLVFTTLPVLRIDGEAIAQNEKGKAICDGTMCLWDPGDPETGRYSVKHSDALWHVRGGWSATLEKTPFKLDLKDKNGENKNLSLMGLGADDDWILNPMNLDDTKLKEKLFMGLWNQRADQTDWNAPMSEGRYVEAVINGEYWGLFQLQRRIDEKFLDLKGEDILLKSSSDANPTTPQSAYEIICSGLPEGETYRLVEDYFYGRDGEMPCMDNFLDVNLFLQCASAMDNRLKNMFYLMKKEDDGYRMHLLPWDTDMSWGVTTHFAYDFEGSRQNVVLREEYAWMRQYHPDLDRQMAKRWLELRESLLTMETMTAIVQREAQILQRSGVRQREETRWGLHYEGRDSLENLYKSLEARLAWVDAYYSQYLS